MSNPNDLASSFMAMAQAVTELPQVKSELDRALAHNTDLLERIQALQLRLIDRANELDAAHAATRKAEVERDHAEQMFCEADDKLIRAKDVLKVLIGDANDFLRVVEPQPEPVAPTPPVEPSHGFEVIHEAMQEVNQVPTGEPVTSTDHTPASADTAPTTSDIAPSNSVQPTAEASEVAPADPTASSTAGDGHLPEIATPTTDAIASDTANTQEPTQTQHSEGVSVPSDPMQATESSSENASSASASQPDLSTIPGGDPTQDTSSMGGAPADLEPELRYSPEWYQWADRVGYWNKPVAAQ